MNNVGESSPSSPSTPATPALPPGLFSLALEPAVHDFLFRATPRTHAQILRSPLQATHAILMCTHATQLPLRTSGDPTVLTSTTPVTANSSLDEHCTNADEDSKLCTPASTPPAVSTHWLLVPACVLGKVSVGVVVERVEVRSSESQQMEVTTRLVRYARSDETGDTLCISEDTTSGTVEVEHVRILSARRSRRVYARFTSNALLSHLRSARGSASISDSRLRASLTHALVLSEARACGVCGATNCSCSYAFATPAHVLDCAYTARNTLPLLGDFRGTGISSAFDNGNEVSRADVATFLATRSGAPPGTTEKLLFWAVQHCLSSARLSPLEFERPLLLSPDTIPEAPLPPTQPATAQSHGRRPAAVAATKPRSRKRPRKPVPAAATPQIVQGVPQPQRAEHLIDTFLRENSGNSQAQMPVSMPVAPVAPVPLASLPVGMQRGPVPIAPAGGGSADAPAANGAEDAADNGLEGYSRAERRKILKREAAARSNAKRRELAALQRAIDAEAARVPELRARVQALTEEKERLTRAARGLAR